MSDSEGDFSDELLELAGATEKRRRKRQSQGKPMKRRRVSGDASASESSETAQSEHEVETENPYPFEGKYVDEGDRERLLSLPEVEREGILAQRQEELQRIQDTRNLDKMYRDRTGGGDDSVSKAAKRQHAQRGATKEKSRKLDELKAKRKAKGEKKRTRTDSPRRDRSSSPMDMEMSDEDEEDGQISKFDQDDEKDRRHDRSKTNDGPIVVDDLVKAQITREMIARLWGRPSFEKILKGAWVRYSCGYDTEHNTPIYRACEIVEVLPKIVKEYKVNDRVADQEFLLRYANQEKAWPMDRVSNTAFTEKEFQKLKSALEVADMTLPTRRELEHKANQIDTNMNLPLTEGDVAAMIAIKKRKDDGRSVAAITLEKSQLHQARTLAVRRKDYAEVTELDKKIALLAGRTSQTQLPAPAEKDTAAQRDRAKMEALRKAEQAELERRRKERKERFLAAEAEGTATPPLSRVKGLSIADSRFVSNYLHPLSTMVEPIVNSACITSFDIICRPGTPGSTESPLAQDPKVDFEASVLDSVEIDLGDF
ncbi:hypothetical protein BC835DRAFT_1322511 [Cytidiella melzeri]|nr:hypothetical protein BC835DRAFT_1322511 [Cytidiella melzeri]